MSKYFTYNRFDNFFIFCSVKIYPYFYTYKHVVYKIKEKFMFENAAAERSEYRGHFVLTRIITLVKLALVVV